MADLLISDIPVTATEVTAADLLEIEQAGVSMQAAIGLVVTLARRVNIVDTITADTITPGPDTDEIRALGLTAGLTIANPSAAPWDGDGFIAYIEDDGTTQELTWGSQYASSAFAALPTDTTAGKRHRLGFEFHAGDDKLYCMYAEVEP